MASLYVKDSATAERVARVAERLGTTKTEALRRALDALEHDLAAGDRDKPSFKERLRTWRALHPPLPATGLTDAKAHADWLCGEEDVVDPFR